MGALSGNFLSDAFDKSDGLSRKPKLDTATVQGNHYKGISDHL